MRRPLNDTITIQMTFKLALSLLVACLSIGAGAVTWSYAFQQQILTQTDQRREMRLEAYPSALQIQKMMEDIQGEQHSDYIDLRNRLDTIRALVYQRTPLHH